MAALSIASVLSEAHKQISPHLHLRRINSENCFEWMFNDGSARHIQRVPVDKIRGLKLDEWLRYARGLAEGKEIEGAPPPVFNAPELTRPTGPAGGANPSFMLVRNKEKPVPFDPDPEVQGYKDAVRGFTACPYGLKDSIERWNRGHDRAYAEGKAESPRFGKKANKRTSHE